MGRQEETIAFVADDGEEVLFRVIEETRLGGATYLLVVDDAGGDGEEALILKEVPKENAEEAFYDIVEEEKELSAVAAVFEELMEDVELVAESETEVGN